MNASRRKRFSSSALLTSWLSTPVGGLVARPWFDRVAFKMLSCLFFPLSRMWAAARVADGSVDRYLDELALASTPRLANKLERLLPEFQQRRRAILDQEGRWEEAFFGGRDSDEWSPEALLAVEQMRLSQRAAYNSIRFKFLSINLGNRVSPIRWNLPTPEEVEAIYGPQPGQGEQFFTIPDPMPEVRESRRLPGAIGTDFWIRFKSPSTRMQDMVTARVYEPVDTIDPPTLIFGHGICVEFDHWRGLVDEVEALVRLGIRVVRPEAPWHGRRVLPGCYSGEPFMATAPAGGLDLFTAAVREWAVLMDWCRRTSKGPVAVGGSSLGAMTAHLVADRARQWPNRLRPDALYLITHCAFRDTMGSSELVETWGIHEATRIKGWTREMTDKYLPLLDTEDLTVVAPHNIISVLGRHDKTTPYASGKALVDGWKLPPENLFILNCGHFSVPLRLIRDQTPTLRFYEIMQRLAGNTGA